MLALVELIVLPYAGLRNRTILHLLVQELMSGRWRRFQAAVAFAKESGNSPDLIDAMARFLKNNGEIEITFGANTFGPDARGSEYEAIQRLLQRMQGTGNFKLHLYYERDRTFHPKLYLFSNEETKRALLIIGSSNWSAGGFYDNVEANAVIWLDLSDGEHYACFMDLENYFSDFWRESE
jgi:HKD family nuclease